jgi:hypothetical protein
MYGAYEIEKILLFGDGTKGIIRLRVDVCKLQIVQLRVNASNAVRGNAKIIA